MQIFHHVLLFVLYFALYVRQLGLLKCLSHLSHVIIYQQVWFKADKIGTYSISMTHILFPTLVSAQLLLNNLLLSIPYPQATPIPTLLYPPLLLHLLFHHPFCPTPYANPLYAQLLSTTLPSTPPLRPAGKCILLLSAVCAIFSTYLHHSITNFCF